MFKEFVLMFILSVIAVVFMHYLTDGVHYLQAFNNYIVHALAKIFNQGRVARVAQSTIALFVIPVVITLIPAAIYGLVKRKLMPYFSCTVWGIWLVLVTILAS